MDPLAFDYASWSTYNYVLGNPVMFVDPDGREVEDPIYDANGKIVGWTVEAGEGPTQIAQKLNELYGCELTCEANWTEIVYNNIDQFENVVNGDGEIDDKYNGDYRSGNIEPGDELVITNGKAPEIASDSKSEELNQLGKKIDSISHEISEQHKRSGNYEGINDFSRKYEKSSREGIGTGAANAISAARNESDSVNNVKKRKALIQKRDSIKQVNQEN